VFKNINATQNNEKSNFQDIRQILLRTNYVQ